MVRAEEDIRALHGEARICLSYMNPAARYLPDGRIDHSWFFDESCAAQGSFARLRHGGVDAIVAGFGAVNKELFPGKMGVARQFQILGNFISEVSNHSDEIELARSAREIIRINRAGKMAVVLHLTGLCLDGDISVLHACHALGVRMIHSPFDDRFPHAGVVGNEKDGLTSLGKEVVRRMDRLGMMVDVSHASDRAFREILTLTDRPVVASHSNCRALCDVSRNLTDEQIREIGKRGGFIGVHFASGFIDLDSMRAFRSAGFHEKLRRWEQSLKRRYPDPWKYLSHRFDPEGWERNPLHAIEMKTPRPPLSKLVDHIERLVELAGIDNVGIGSDYDLGSIPTEVDHADKLPALTRALLERGYSPREVKKLWGENFLRVFREIAG